MVNQGEVDFLYIQDSDHEVVQYRGLTLDSQTAGGNLGSTTVTARELNPGEWCPGAIDGSVAYARRCYTIEPTTLPTTAVTVRLYARTDDELFWIPTERLRVYRQAADGEVGWLMLPQAASGVVGAYSYAEGETTLLGAFLLGDETPPQRIFLPMTAVSP
jgi:hypothetical protein